MFQDSVLKSHIEQNTTLQIKSFIVGEWNLNDLENISASGNYRYRPLGSSFNNLPMNFNNDDATFINALDSSIKTEYVVENDGQTPISFVTPELSRKLYYSLEDCFLPFRPRSGINKVVLRKNKYIDNIRSGTRPRYYMASKYDKFKYWTSYRKEENVERGISSQTETALGYYIEDSCPFVVYKESMFANRVVVKMQTNLSDDENSSETVRMYTDEIIKNPLNDRTKSSIPKVWSIQYLDETNTWVDAISFDENSTRRDGSEIVPWDGYVEVYYGLIAPNDYRQYFNFVDYLDLQTQLPGADFNNNHGDAYLVGGNETNIGTLYIWNDNNNKKIWEAYTPNYGFSLLQDSNINFEDTKQTGLARSLVNPKYVNTNNARIYRDFIKLKGLRLVIKTMNSPDNPFDLIELSPRIKADMSDYTLGFNFNKAMAKNDSGIPVGGLVASNGSITLMNFDSAFSEQNTNSVVADKLKNNIKFDFYERVLKVTDIDGLKYDKFVPLKSLYAETFPKAVGGLNDITIQLRDAYFRLETSVAPTIFLKNVTLTAAVAILLDNIGFSNYVFKAFENNYIYDPIIPYFFVEPDVSVAEVLERLAISTQSAMFFDEYNNFVVMPKEYLMPDQDKRSIDLTLYGQTTPEVSLENPSADVPGTNYKLSNIFDLVDGETPIINDGQINYTNRYIQKSPSSLSQASYIDEDITYVYKPVLLWEIAQQQFQISQNEAASSGDYTLSAAPLNSNITDVEPYVELNIIKNNVIDLGENVMWLQKFNGYLYANGEIIRYDAIEYMVYGGVEVTNDPLISTTPTLSNKVWITNSKQYEQYFGQLPFNGKMFRTGNVRIYVKPYYQLGGNGVVYKNGAVKEHGRAQFGTKITDHSAGLPDYWSDNTYLRGMNMRSEYLFNTLAPIEVDNRYGFVDTVYPQYVSGSAQTVLTVPTFQALGQAVGVDNGTATRSSRNGVIANFLRQTVPSDDVIRYQKTTSAATIQSSALVFTGPNPMTTGVTPKNFVTYIYKEMTNDFKHFGTRMRIIGKPESTDELQTATNASEYYIVEDSIVSGGSGGLGVMVNPTTNYGYYFEICALTGSNLQDYNVSTTNGQDTVLENVMFYKVVPGTIGSDVHQAIPKKLWGGLAQILVDDGGFVGQDRLMNIENPTVYDLAVEYENIGTTRRFYLYINNKLIAIVDDPEPLPVYNNAALFVRGSSKCMFENIYALKNLQSQQTNTAVIKEIDQTFYNNQITSSDALRRYAVSGLVKGSYLSNIGIDSPTKYDMYFEEFGTIMRECAYFNIKYDQAYPAFIAQIAKTFSNERSFTISGFRAGSYGAEFLIFNSTDKTIVLGENSSNYLKIHGITFTQSTSHTLSVDEFVKDNSTVYSDKYVDRTIFSPISAEQLYQDIRLSRSKYGKKGFSLESVYIQNKDEAESLMSWIIQKTLRQRKDIAASVFGASTIQLGDIVSIDYVMPGGYRFVDKDKKFVVYEMEYSSASGGPETKLRMVEV